MASITIRRNTKYESIYGAFRKDPNANDPYYSLEIANPRKQYYLSSSHFKKDPILKKLDAIDLSDYFPSFVDLPDLFTKRCPDTY